MWEPFSEEARQAIVRAQAVAQMFGSSTIGTEHIAFALDEGGDATATALAQSLDRDAIKERLGVARGAPSTEMVFGVSAKRAIEYAFENARRLGHHFIGTPHLALGMLATDDPPPLVDGVDLVMLRARLDAVAENSVAENATAPQSRWALRDGTADPFAKLLGAVIDHYDRVSDLGPPGTRVAVNVTPPGGAERVWVFERADAP
jgi:ATP-dependent Clp protease ATP-binding subunit ClpA